MTEFQTIWSGRKFRCIETNTIFEVPDSVQPKDFYRVGSGFLDVGNDAYCRMSGIEEVLECGLIKA